MPRLTAVVMPSLLPALLLSAVTGCTSPMDRTAEQELRETLMQSHRQFTRAIARGEITTEREPSAVEQELRRREGLIEQLDERSGIDALRDQPLELGPDLEGAIEAEKARLSLQQAIQSAVQNNIDYRAARLIPAARRTEIVQAEAAFDATFFTGIEYGRRDTPEAQAGVPGLGDLTQHRLGLETGIRKRLTTGGQVELATGFERTATDPTVFEPDPRWTPEITLGLQQPLLRGFGTDVNTASIQLADSAHRQSVEELRQSLIELVDRVEGAYWALVQARQQLLIQTRLLEQTVREREVLDQRRILDVRPSTYTEVLAQEEVRRAEVIRARQQVRRASDALKRLINDPDLPLAGEELIVPENLPVDLPLKFNLLDAVTTALRERPEMRRALMRIQDASLRQRVADNLRLPMLDLNFNLRLHELQGDLGSGYGDIFTERNLIDFMVGAQFEVPLGNRDAEALYSRRTIERHQSVLDYQRLSQDVVQEVKDAMRDLLTAYELIGATRASRRAAAENLRALEAEQEVGVPLTPEFIDLKLRRQEALANAQQREMEALVAYNNAISSFFKATGTLLERSQIDFTRRER